jgi:hypothetical protein
MIVSVISEITEGGSNSKNGTEELQGKDRVNCSWHKAPKQFNCQPFTTAI